MFTCSFTSVIKTTLIVAKVWKLGKIAQCVEMKEVAMENVIGETTFINVFMSNVMFPNLNTI